jgi:dihydrofolate reductase
MSASSGTTRRVVANVTLSLDGHTNGRGGDHDIGWIVPHAITDAARDHMIRVTEGATTALLGRKNFEGFASFWPSVADDAAADPRDRTFSRWLNSVDKVVFSSTANESNWPNTTFVNAEAATVIDDLRHQGGGDMVIVASGSVIKELLVADLVDRLSINLAPEIVGGGTRLLDGALPLSSWWLVDSTPTGSGALLLLYDIVRHR